MSQKPGGYGFEWQHLYEAWLVLAIAPIYNRFVVLQWLCKALILQRKKLKAREFGWLAPWSQAYEQPRQDRTIGSVSLIPHSPCESIDTCPGCLPDKTDLNSALGLRQAARTPCVSPSDTQPGGECWSSPRGSHICLQVKASGADTPSSMALVLPDLGTASFLMGSAWEICRCFHSPSVSQDPASWAGILLEELARGTAGLSTSTLWDFSERLSPNIPIFLSSSRWLWQEDGTELAGLLSDEIPVKIRLISSGRLCIGCIFRGEYTHVEVLGIFQGRRISARAVMTTQDFSALSPATTYQMPVAFPQCLPDVVQCLLGTKLPPVENHYCS